MWPQVERAAEGKAGGVWMEGSAEGTLQRYVICCVVCVLGLCATVTRGFSEVFYFVLSRCDQRKGPGARHSGGPGHRSHTERQRYRSSYANHTQQQGGEV